MPMRVKRGVNTKQIHPNIWFACGVCYAILLGLFVATSMRRKARGEHANLVTVRKLHPKGLALDVRTKNMSKYRARATYWTLKYMLEPLGFDVVDEIDSAVHIHIEWDPKPGEVLFKEVK